MVQHYQELIVWQKAMELVERVYRMTRTFPKDERFGLTSQIQRAAVSIPSNIAEGHARSSKKEYRNFLSISQGSTAEVETQTLIAARLGYVTSKQTENIMSLLDEISRMLNAIKKKLAPRPSPLAPRH